jgi:hypothetical protein
VHILRHHAVQRTFNGRDRAKRCHRSVLYPAWRLTPAHELGDFRDVTTSWLRRNVKVNFGAGDVAPFRLSHSNLHAIVRQATWKPAKPLLVEVHLDERAEHHVTGNAAEWI